MRGQYDARVCENCFFDFDLRQIIREEDGRRGCSFCGRKDAPTIDFDKITDHIEKRLEEHFGKAVDRLPFESAEGGYQDWTADTRDLLFDAVGLDLPRDNDESLRNALIAALPDEVWCHYNWPFLDPDEKLYNSWERFCEIVKHQRRFFFQDIGADQFYGRDIRSPKKLLQKVCCIAEVYGLIRDEPTGYKLFRARPRIRGELHKTPASLGPPPPERAIQANRMNPPGIPMFYAADRAVLAMAEVRDKRVSIGEFETLRKIRVLDLSQLADPPGFFSDVSRDCRLILEFLCQFGEIVAQAVPRDDRAHLEYVPTQVFTEFLRDHEFKIGTIDGLRYRSATPQKGANVVLFATPDDVEGAVVDPAPWRISRPWLRLRNVSHRR